MTSAVIHTYNEENNIDSCLKSLDFCDEIVVIDMGSTDKTLQIAASYNAKIFNHRYTGYVEPARNFGIGKARGDWILIVDADERIPGRLASEIVKITGGKNSEFNFFRISRKNMIFGRWIKHAGWWPDYQLRLFKKGSVVWNEKIHSVPATRGRGKDLTAASDLAIFHLNYDSISDYLSKLNRYTDIQAKELKAQGVTPSLADLILKPSNEFLQRFFVGEGYRDGFHGLSLCLLQYFSESVVLLKIWELKGFPAMEVDLNEYSAVEERKVKNQKYWLLSKLLNSKPGILSSLLLRIRRKFSS